MQTHSSLLTQFPLTLTGSRLGGCRGVSQVPSAVWRCDAEGGCCSCSSGFPALHSPWDLQDSLQDLLCGIVLGTDHVSWLLAEKCQECLSDVG